MTVHKTYAAGSTYTMPAHAVTFTAQWTKQLPAAVAAEALPGQPKAETENPWRCQNIQGSTSTPPGTGASSLLAEAPLPGLLLWILAPQRKKSQP